MGQLQKRMSLYVIIVVWYFVFLEDGWSDSSRLLARYLPEDVAQNVDLCVIHGQLCCLRFHMPKGGTSTPSQKITKVSHSSRVLSSVSHLCSLSSVER